jgi:tRNA (guanine-N7-)-methyltransferase
MSPHPQTARAFFGRRKGHKLRPRRAELFDTLLPRLAVDLSRPAPTNLHALFPAPVGDIQLEIGFGAGENIIAQATGRPLSGFIGVEPFANGMAKALSVLESTGLRNVRLHFDDAASLLPWLPRAALSRIELIHPDPWPKRRHWKRRFVQDETIAQFARVLRPGGDVRFVTDVADYAAWTLQHFLRSSDFAWTAQQADDWRKAWPGFAGTRYHAKATQRQLRPCFLVFCRL